MFILVKGLRIYGKTFEGVRCMGSSDGKLCYSNLCKYGIGGTGVERIENRKLRCLRQS